MLMHHSLQFRICKISVKPWKSLVD